MGHVPVYIYYDASQDISWNYTLSGGNATIGDGTLDTTYGNATTLGANLSGAITIPQTIPYGRILLLVLANMPSRIVPV